MEVFQTSCTWMIGYNALYPGVTQHVVWLVTWTPLQWVIVIIRRVSFPLDWSSPRGGKKRWGPNENNCFSCYLATADRHMLYIPPSIANWCSVMTTTRIAALKVYLTRYPSSKFKDVFGWFTWRKEWWEKTLFPVESRTRQDIGFIGCYTHMSLVCANPATTVTVLLFLDVTTLVNIISVSNKPQVMMAIFPASSTHTTKHIFYFSTTLKMFFIWSPTSWTLNQNRWWLVSLFFYLVSVFCRSLNCNSK